MYIYREKATELISDLKNNITSQIEEKKDFLFSLLEDDDWSLVIKSHALVESIITDLIIARLEEDHLKPVIERLPLHDNQFGKLKIIKAYDLLTDEQRSFVKNLSELRNNLVHKFENIGFEFSVHIRSFDKNQKTAWKNALTWHSINSESCEAWEKASLANTKIAFWFSVFMLVSLTVLQIEEIKGSTKINKVAAETTGKLLKDIV